MVKRYHHSPKENLAVALRRAGFHRLEHHEALKRLESLGITGRRARNALAMAADTKSNPDQLKRQHSRQLERSRLAGMVKYPSNGKGRRSDRVQGGYVDANGEHRIIHPDTHTERLPEPYGVDDKTGRQWGYRGRKRSTDEPNPSGNQYEQWLARNLRGSGLDAGRTESHRDTGRGERNSTPAHTFRHTGDTLTRSSRGYRVNRGKVIKG